MNAPTKTLNTANAENFHRSARAPVGIVAAVSMKTIWNRKYANTGAVYATPVRKNPVPPNRPQSLPAIDRKSTRLNSSHGYISYAVFCLKKKKKEESNIIT